MAERIALVRVPSPRMADGIVTHIERSAVDPRLAERQHDAYVDALAQHGWTIREVPPALNLPDSAFVEDTVVVVDHLAVLANPGAPDRQAEVPGTEEVVRQLRLDVARIEPPGTLDGGDVLQVGPTVYVGRGGRTNAEGIRQLRRHAAGRGRTVVPVRLHGVLHLKSAVTALPDGTFVAFDTSLFDRAPFPTMRVVPEEAGSHVVLMGGGTILMAASAPRSAAMFDDLGFDVITVDIGEYEKREGCVTCLSVLVAGDRY
jgi:dimethylargininase